MWIWFCVLPLLSAVYTLHVLTFIRLWKLFILHLFISSLLSFLLLSLWIKLEQFMHRHSKSLHKVIVACIMHNSVLFLFLFSISMHRAFGKDFVRFSIILLFNIMHMYAQCAHVYINTKYTHTQTHLTASPLWHDFTF